MTDQRDHNGKWPSNLNGGGRHWSARSSTAPRPGDNVVRLGARIEGSANLYAKPLSSVAIDGADPGEQRFTHTEGNAKPGNHIKLNGHAGLERRRTRLFPGSIMSAVDEMEQAFLELGPGPVYQRNGDLVVLRQTSGGDGSADERSGIEIVSATVDMIAAWAEEVCAFEHYKREHWRPCDLPRRVPELFKARPSGWRLPELRGLASCPTLRRDGSLLCIPGYDVHTGLYLFDTISVRVPENPSQSEAEQARDDLVSFFSAFPLAGRDIGNLLSLSVAIAGLIGAILRPSVSTAPGIGVTGPVAGTGKSYFVNVNSHIVTGRPVESINVSNHPEEFRKALAAKLSGAPAIVSLDNVERPLSGALLAQALSEPVVEDRLLGKSQMLRISSTTAIFATGNNLQINGDLARRFLICQLDAGVERPETRSFERDPLAEAVNRRSELLSAALTIARYGFNLEDHGHWRGFPGFQEWYRMVARPLVALGLPDPVDSLALARATDPEQEQLEALMAAWWVQYGDQVVTCKKIVDTAGLDLEEALKAVASARNGEPCTQRLGQYLSRVQGRIIANKRFIRLSKGGEGVRWCLEKVKSSAK